MDVDRYGNGYWWKISFGRTSIGYDKVGFFFCWYAELRVENIEEKNRIQCSDEAGYQGIGWCCCYRIFYQEERELHGIGKNNDGGRD